jgi:hypothetical protein
MVPRAWVTDGMFSYRQRLGAGELGQSHLDVLGAALALASGHSGDGVVPLRLCDLRRRLERNGLASRERRQLRKLLAELAEHECVGMYVRATGHARAPYELCNLPALARELAAGTATLDAPRRWALRLNPLAAWLDMLAAAGCRPESVGELVGLGISTRDARRNLTHAVRALAAAGGEQLELQRGPGVRADRLARAGSVRAGAGEQACGSWHVMRRRCVPWLVAPAASSCVTTTCPP